MTKRWAIVGIALLLMVLVASRLWAQEGSMESYGGQVVGGVGVTWIDEEPWFTISLQPEVSLGRFGFGLNINFLYTSNPPEGEDNLREADLRFNNLIRYIRFGHKRDPVYLRLGALDDVVLGHGFIVNHYTNQLDYDERKLGLELDINLPRGGFETMTSSLNRWEIVGGRIYYRPLKGILPIPLVKNLALGATYVTDLNPDELKGTKDGVSIWGIDVEIPLVSTTLFESMIYTDFAKANNFGQGVAAGVGAHLRGIANLFAFSSKLERRWLGEEFLPNYFDALYEKERIHKADSLGNVGEVNGVFGELAGHVIDKVTVLGNYQYYSDVKHSGVLHAEAQAPDLIPKFSARAAYDKKGIETLEDLRTLDDRSVATAELGYKIKPYLLVVGQYRWTFTYNDERERYEPQERFSTRLDLSLSF